MARKMKSVRINQHTDASLDVDAQTTFMPAHDGFPDGGLAVRDGHLVLPVILRTWDLFAKKLATCDRHPRGHISLASAHVGRQAYDLLTLDDPASFFLANGDARFTHSDVVAYLKKVGRQVLWPDHALDGTPEGELHPSLRKEEYLHVQVKGTDPLCDSYSGFQDNLKRPTGLADVLKKHGVKRLFLRGLAFDFCVGWTALDAVAEGFETYILEDATRPVDMPGTVDKMRQDLDAAGVKLIRSNQLRTF